jgi:hypothetical protein
MAHQSPYSHQTLDDKPYSESVSTWIRLIPWSGASSNALNRVSNLTILGCPPPPLDFFLFLFKKIIGKMLYFSEKKGIIHSHRDLNSVSSSTDKTNLLGPMTSRLRSPAPRVRTRAAGSSTGRNTSLSLKPAARNSLELISLATGGRDVSTSGVHSWNVSPDASSSTLLSHRLMTRAESLL